MYRKIWEAAYWVRLIHVCDNNLRNTKPGEIWRVGEIPHDSHFV